eukprot:12053375-Alexandrium_andersonii.AAC.1
MAIDAPPSTVEVVCPGRGASMTAPALSADASTGSDPVRCPPTLKRYSGCALHRGSGQPAFSTTPFFVATEA